MGLELQFTKPGQKHLALAHGRVKALGKAFRKTAMTPAVLHVQSNLSMVMGIGWGAFVARDWKMFSGRLRRSRSIAIILQQIISKTRTKQGEARQDQTRRTDQTRQDKTKEKTRHGKARQGKARQEKARQQGKALQSKARQDKTR
jgi:hypothetical protein